MADLGTVGSALAKSPPPPDATPTPDPPSTDMSQADTANLRDVVGANRSGTRALLGRLSDIDKRSDALQPPVMEKPPPPPEAKNTPVADRWGSVAMMLAGFGGLLTRQPLTASLNAMAGVNHAFNDRDTAAAASAFATWKVENENAIKMNDFHVKTYEGALKKFATDRTGAIAEIRANASALKDDVVMQLLDSGQTDRAIGLLGGRAAASPQLSERSAIVAAHTEQKLAFRQANPNATPAQLADADLKIMMNKPLEPPEKPETPGLYEERLEKQFVDERVAAWKAKPENAGKEPTAEQKIDWKHEATAGGKPVTGAAAKEKDADLNATQKFRDTHEGRDPGADDVAEMAKLRQAERQHQATQAGRTAAMIQRTMTSAADAVTDIKNVVELPISLSTGIFGGRQQGPSLMAATKEILANKVTSEEAQAYNTALAGIGRAMGGLSTGGQAVSDDIMRSFKQLDIVEGDTNLIKLRKVATMRQNVENALDALLTNPALTDQQIKEADGLRQALIAAVPYSVHDVNQVEFSKNRGAKVSDFAKSSGVEAALPAEALSHLTEGHETKFANGQTWTLRNGKPEQVQNGR